MGSAVFFLILRSILLLYSAWSVVNRVQVLYGCMYFLAVDVLVCVDVTVISSAYAMT